MEEKCDTQETPKETLEQLNSLECSKPLKNLLPNGGERNLTKISKELHLFSNNKFLMWENDSNICWLDASLALLVHNQTMRCVIKQKPNCQVSKILKGYDEAITTLNNSNKSLEERLQIARKLLKKVQENSLKYLQPLIKCKRGEPDSAFCSLYNLIKEDKLIQSFFNVSYAWVRQCKNCGNKNVPAITKPIITIANVDIFVPENHISPCRCHSCEKNDQTMKLVYKKLPPCLIFHFERGAGVGENPPLSFHMASREYQLTGIMVLEKSQESNVNHFVTYVRGLSDRWLECNDLNTNITTFSSKLPKFNLKDIYIYVYEAFDELGTIEILEDLLLNNSYQSIKCIDISDETDDYKDVEQNITSNDNELEENIENISAYLSGSLPATIGSELCSEKHLPSAPNTLNCNLISQKNVSKCDNSVLDMVDKNTSGKSLLINSDEKRNIQEVNSSDTDLQKIYKSVNRQTKGKELKEKIDPSDLSVKINKIQKKIKLKIMNNEKKQLKVNSFEKDTTANNAKTSNKASESTVQADDSKSNTCRPVQDVYIPELSKIDTTKLDVKLISSEKVCVLNKLENNQVYDNKDVAKNRNVTKNEESTFVNIDQKVHIKTQNDTLTDETALFSSQGNEIETGLDSNCDNKQKPCLSLSSFSCSKQHAASTNEHHHHNSIRTSDESLLRMQQMALTEIENQNAKVNDFNHFDKLSKYKSNKLNILKVKSVYPNKASSHNKTENEEDTDDSIKEADSPMLKFPVNPLEDNADNYDIEHTINIQDYRYHGAANFVKHFKSRMPKKKILRMKMLSKKRTKHFCKTFNKQACRSMKHSLGESSIAENVSDISNKSCVDKLTIFAKERKVVSHTVEHKFPTQSKDASHINILLSSKCVRMNEDTHVKKCVNSVRNFLQKKNNKQSIKDISLNLNENQTFKSPKHSVASTSYKHFADVPSADNFSDTDNFHNSVKQCEVISECNSLNESIGDANDQSKKRKLSNSTHQERKRHAIDAKSYSEENEIKIITNGRQLKHDKTPHYLSSESSENISAKTGCPKSNCNCRKFKREMVVDGVVDTVLIHLFKVFKVNKT